MTWTALTSPEDDAVRCLRAAENLIEDPERLETVLCHLLDAAPATEGGPGRLVLDDGSGPDVRLRRSTPFTDTELARAAELRRLARSIWPSDVPEPAEQQPPAVDDEDDRSLVALLHRRAELRVVCPAADVIDAALRDGA